MDLLQKAYNASPEGVQNLMVTASNWWSLRRRRGGAYGRWKRYFAESEFLPYADIVALQQERLQHFLAFAAEQSAFHRERLHGFDPAKATVESLSSLPQMSKEDLRTRLAQIATLPRAKASVGRSGGTTGASIEVFYRWDDFQERTALTDLYRERFVRLERARIAWFSGKALIPDPTRTKSFGRSDYLSRMRFYSTFDISPATISRYLDDLNDFRPNVMVGFPSSLCDLTTLARKAGLRADFTPGAVFVTAETLTDQARATIGGFFGCGVHDQYASSEGAPFITECPEGRLHQEMLSGVFEVLDEKGLPAREGDLVVTAFGTRGTPLVRYRIGDRVRLADAACGCGRETTVVERIEGRQTDFLYSPDRGRINLVNVANSAKNVSGIRKFQVIQRRLDAVEILVAADPDFTPADHDLLVRNLRDRLGGGMNIGLAVVDDIPREASGKHRIVKNMLGEADFPATAAVAERIRSDVA